MVMFGYLGLLLAGNNTYFSSKLYLSLKYGNYCNNLSKLYCFKDLYKLNLILFVEKVTGSRAMTAVNVAVERERTMAT